MSKNRPRERTSKNTVCGEDQNRTRIADKLSDKDTEKEKIEIAIEQEDGAADVVGVDVAEELISVIVRCGSCIDVVLETAVL